MTDQLSAFVFDRLPGGDEFPRAKPAEGEQDSLPLAGTIAGEYRAWQATDEGRAFLAEVERLALADADAGERRIEINLLWALTRRNQKVMANNDFRSLAARALRDRHPHLRPLIRVRQRTAT